MKKINNKIDILKKAYTVLMYLICLFFMITWFITLSPLENTPFVQKFGKWVQPISAVASAVCIKLFISLTFGKFFNKRSAKQITNEVIANLSGYGLELEQKEKNEIKFKEVKQTKSEQINTILYSNMEDRNKVQKLKELLENGK